MPQELTMSEKQHYQTKARVVAGQDFPQPIEPPEELGSGWELIATNPTKDADGLLVIWTWSRQTPDVDGDFLVQ